MQQVLVKHKVLSGNSFKRKNNSSFEFSTVTCSCHHSRALLIASVASCGTLVDY